MVDNPVKSYAITIDINPRSYVTTYLDGTRCRKMWYKYSNDDQGKFILSNIYAVAGEIDIVDYAFENTQAGNKHIHMFVKGTGVAVQNYKIAFCNQIQRRMPVEMQNRCVYIERITDGAGWLSYVHKEQPKTPPTSPDYIPDYNMFKQITKPLISPPSLIVSQSSDL